MNYRDYTASEKTMLKSALKAFNKAMSLTETSEVYDPFNSNADPFNSDSDPFVSSSDPFDSDFTVETDPDYDWDLGF